MARGRSLALGAGGVLLVGLVARAVLATPPGESVDVAAAVRGPIESTVLASGHLEPRVHVELRPEIAGTVTALRVAPGDRVVAGQPLLTIEAGAYRADVDERAASMRIARDQVALRAAEVAHLERTVARDKELAAGGLVAGERVTELGQELELARLRLRQARASVAQAEATLAHARVSLDKSEVVAPRAGVVLAVDVEVGEVVVPATLAGTGATLLTIADPASLVAEVEVDEADVRAVAVGQPVRVYPVADDGGAPVAGRVVAVAPRAERVEGRRGKSFRVDVALTPDGADVRPGMSCRAEIVTAARPAALLVPSQAVVRDDRAVPPVDVVFVVEGGTARRVAVGLGLGGDRDQEIAAGLELGATVVVGPSATLRRLRHAARFAARPRP